MSYSERSPHAREPLPAYGILRGRTCFDCPDNQCLRTRGGGNITGTVKDKSGNPIIGAAVTIPNTARGTSTDIDGRYTIKASAKESLNFSYIGYQSQLIQINNRTTIDVVLTEDNTSLEEVVVVGYGVQKKRDIVGAVEQISSKDIADRIGSYQNVSRSLQGAIPGLTVTFSDGKPTRGASFQVRGANSIGAGGSTLVLIDGVEGSINATAWRPTSRRSTPKTSRASRY